MTDTGFTLMLARQQACPFYRQFDFAGVCEQMTGKMPSNGISASVQVRDAAGKRKH